MFRTELPLTPHPQQLPLSTRVLTVGSCFSDTIGHRLAETKVSTLVNPFGTVFNPLSACQLLRAAAGEDMDWQQHLVEARGRWQSYDLHATIGADSPVTLLQRIQGLVQEVGEFLAQTDVVVLTLGTAYAYRLLETDEVVNNCHKVPAEKFEKVLLTPDEIINAVAETHAYLRRANPKLRFILTVSPVRHVKDTLPLNSVSKSVLRVACHYLSELLPDVSYFPAYELLVDDLRDYRFYAADMLHPSDVAENYIWERFTRTYFDPAFGRFRREWEAVRQALGHRPLYPEAAEHREFLEATLGRLHRLASQADVHAEIGEVERQLAALPLPKPQPVPEPELEDDDEERIDIGEPTTELIDVVTAVVPVATPLVTSEPAADEAAEPEEAEEDEYDTEDTPEENLGISLESEAPVFVKKKRRSRGGAKRTARKRAAQQAAEAAAAASVSATATVEPQEPEQQAAVAAEPEVELEAALTVSGGDSTAEPVLAEPAAQPEAAPAETPAPIVRTETPKPEPAPNVDWLQPMDEPEETPEPRRRGQKSRGKGQIAAEKKPRDTKDRIITTPPTKSRRKPAPLYAEPVVAPEETVEAVQPVVVETVIPEATAPLAPEPSITLDAPTPEATSATEPTPVEAAPVETVVPEPVQAAPTLAPARKPRASRAKAATAPKEAEATPETPQPTATAPKKAPARKPAPKKPKAATPAPAPAPAPAADEPQPAAPKKRSRPPRKKPGAADETPAAS
ncbi:GSCFA domain-containing protein [Hymenobacter cellulosivorans]|uniref:GSCFA domain-containing protein n=1 Tax=Hymenobacter cellulosivorans TaxID=2932249 RepID=A0ABY4F8R3_9BACT|nr:GSCFA domain-containing protein [Hymenobacter cellulosivorans]UOQ52820.1 GSCFA domain-containing protein [Hymenobacter cellulosivorans]